MARNDKTGDGDEGKKKTTNDGPSLESHLGNAAQELHQRGVKRAHEDAVDLYTGIRGEGDNLDFRKNRHKLPRQVIGVSADGGQATKCRRIKLRGWL